MIKTDPSPASNRLDPRDIRHRFLMPVRSLEKLPPDVREIVQSRGTQPSILRVPSNAYPVRRGAWGIRLPFGWRFTPERFLLFDLDSTTIIESETMTVTEIPLDALIEIHHVAVLLYAYLELVWVDGAQIETRKIEYNAVGQYLIEREINRIRALHPPCLAQLAAPDRETLLAPLPYKFRSYLRSSLLEDEHLLAVVFQPAIRQAIKPFRSYLTPNRALGVTERCLIVVEDQQHQRQAETNYAIQHDFYPLRHLQNIDFETTADAGWLRLHHDADGVTRQTDIPLLPEALDVLRGVLSVNLVSS